MYTLKKKKRSVGKIQRQIFIRKIWIIYSESWYKLFISIHVWDPTSVWFEIKASAFHWRNVCFFYTSLSLNLRYLLILPRSFSPVARLPSSLSVPRPASPCLRLWLCHSLRISPLCLPHLIMSGATSAFCFALLVSVSTGRGLSSWSPACLRVDTETLCLMRKEELSTWSSLFEHVQCAIMLDHLFLLRGW